VLRTLYVNWDLVIRLESRRYALFVRRATAVVIVVPDSPAIGIGVSGLGIGVSSYAYSMGLIYTFGSSTILGLDSSWS